MRREAVRIKGEDCLLGRRRRRKLAAFAPSLLSFPVSRTIINKVTLFLSLSRHHYTRTMITISTRMERKNQKEWKCKERKEEGEEAEEGRGGREEGRKRDIACERAKCFKAGVLEQFSGASTVSKDCQEWNEIEKKTEKGREKNKEKERKRKKRWNQWEGKYTEKYDEEKNRRKKVRKKIRTTFLSTRQAFSFLFFPSFSLPLFKCTNNQRIYFSPFSVSIFLFLFLSFAISVEKWQKKER